MNWQSALDPSGAQAARIHAHWLLFWYVCLAVYLIVGGFFLYLLLRSRRRPAEGLAEATRPVQHRMGRAVAAATGVTAFTLVLLLISAAITGSGLAAYGEKPDIQIDLLGHQWWWDVTYKNDDPSKTLRTANEIHIPTGRKVMLGLSSADVIHSFWIPSLNGKRDLIPGRSNRIVIEADRPGVYRGQCAEYCGLQHAHMILYVVADSPANYAAWYDRQLQPAPEPADDSARRGRDVFLGAPCILCHAVRGTTALGTAGPDLTHLATRRAIGAGTLPNTPGHLAGWITDSQTVKPGNRMPAIPIPPQDLQPLLAYLESLK